MTPEPCIDCRRRLGTWQVLGLSAVLVLAAILLIDTAERHGWPRGLVVIIGGAGAGIFAGWLADRIGDDDG